jgi:hypothetical protein
MSYLIFYLHNFTFQSLIFQALIFLTKITIQIKIINYSCLVKANIVVLYFQYIFTKMTNFELYFQLFL